MNCNIIKDLLPLYVDDCCSAESAQLVKEHLALCPHCKELYEKLSDNAPLPLSDTPAPPAKRLLPLRLWQAALLQSILLLLSFALITLGVSLEAQSPFGFSNGIWALWLVAPATGFMLSLCNWYFVRLYKSRRAFWISSLLLTITTTLCAYLWVIFHYDYHIFFSFNGTLSDVLERLYGFIVLYCEKGILLSALLCTLSAVLSNLYAKMLGKE